MAAGANEQNVVFVEGFAVCPEYMASEELCYLDTTFVCACSNKTDNYVKQKQYFILFLCVICQCISIFYHIVVDVHLLE